MFFASQQRNDTPRFGAPPEMRRSALRGALFRGALAGSVVLGVAVGLVRRAEAQTTGQADEVRAVLSVEATGRQWVVRVENVGETPIRLIADPNLLAFDLAPPVPQSDSEHDPGAGKRSLATAEAKSATSKRKPAKPLRCALPADVRSSSLDDLEVTVPAKQSWSTTIDPLYYCFSARERTALVAGATLTPHLGWASPLGKTPAKKPSVSARRGPFVVTPLRDEREAGTAGTAESKAELAARELVGTPVTLERNVLDAAPGPQAPGPQAPVAVRVPPALDSARGVDLVAPVSVVNRSLRPVTLFFRPNLIRFLVDGPTGSTECGSFRSVDAPIRELFATVAPKGSTSHSISLDQLCPRGTFNAPGIYRAEPIVDTSRASGSVLGLKTFDAEIRGEAMLVRVLRARAARPLPAVFVSKPGGDGASPDQAPADAPPPVDQEPPSS